MEVDTHYRDINVILSKSWPIFPLEPFDLDRDAKVSIAKGGRQWTSACPPLMKVVNGSSQAQKFGIASW